MTSIERYALDMICDGAQDGVEDDTNADGTLTPDEHDAATLLADRVIRAMRSGRRREQLLMWARGEDDS